MIITDEKLLRVHCENVLPEEVPALRETLEKELQESADRGFPGIGLACPQIGIPKRMAIIRVPLSNGIMAIDLVNPVIEKAWDKAIFEAEGCLSFPGLEGKTFRFKEILVSNEVYPKRFVAMGLPAVVIQHEIDHLLETLLPDRLKELND